MSTFESGSAAASAAERRLGHHHQREHVVVRARWRLELGDGRRKDREVGERLVLLATEDPTQLGDDIVGVRRAPPVVVEVVGRTKAFETHPVIQRSADAVVDVGIASSEPSNRPAA